MRKERTRREAAVRGREAKGLGRRPQGTRAPAALRKPAGRRASAAPSSGAWWAVPLMLAYALALCWLVWQGRAPWWLLPASLLLNLATFFAYWRDKHAAQQGRWRVKENTLHLWSLAGGWGGAWWAQQLLRHKSAKASFRAAYRATAAIHCAAAFGLWWFA